MLTDCVPGQWLVLTLADYTQELRFVETYGAGLQDQLICLINSQGEFEIALPCGSASARLGVRVGETVILRPGRAVA
jgi:S-adenosylmethionine hydrolase